MARILYTHQTAQWRSYLYRLPAYLNDIHFLPEMMLPYEETGLGRGMLAVVEQYDNFMIQPLLRMNDGVLRHPYNFGGPIATEDFKPEELPFPCEFTMNPFLHKWQFPLLGSGKAHPVKATVWVDLTKPLEVRDDTKYRIRRAEKAGVLIRWVEPNKENILNFYALYIENMKRLAAADHWLLPSKWFFKLFWHLKDKASLFHAKLDEKIVGACILIHAYGTCYYHFSACERSKQGVSHKLLMSVIELAKEQGLQRFHLGGGITHNDSLFEFKSGFSDLREMVFKFKSKVDTNELLATG